MSQYLTSALQHGRINHLSIETKRTPFLFSRSKDVASPLDLTRRRGVHRCDHCQLSRMYAQQTIKPHTACAMCCQ
ncbi:hypothetical protein D3C76_1646850 [compost metagenome]